MGQEINDLLVFLLFLRFFITDCQHKCNKISEIIHTLSPECQLAHTHDVYVLYVYYNYL